MHPHVWTRVLARVFDGVLPCVLHIAQLWLVFGLLGPPRPPTVLRRQQARLACRPGAVVNRYRPTRVCEQCAQLRLTVP